METLTDFRGSMFRMCFLLLVGGWMVLGPAYRQVFDGKSEWFPRWVMFHGFGRNVCDVRFYRFDEAADGSTVQTPLDRFEVLDKRRDWATNKSLVRMSSKADVEKVGSRLCRALGPGADVRALARCGSRDHWKGKLNFSIELCKKQKFNRRIRPRILR